MELIFGGSTILYFLIVIILPITLFITLIIITSYIARIKTLLEDNRENQEQILKMLIVINRNKKDYNHEDV